MPKQKTIHQPVLLAEVLDLLAPQAGESYLDLTAGYGGHAKAILERTKAPERAVLVDRDPTAIEQLAGEFGSSQIINKDFASASQEQAASGQKFDMILADLGVSSPHLDSPERGFSFSNPGKLDMRMDQRQDLSAEEIVNHWSPERIAQILKLYGQEPKASQIAKLIALNRPIKSTDQLAQVVKQAWPGKSRHHPATRTFQAVRIAVNDEIGQLEKSLPIWRDLLAAGGRLAIISFHSLEDRLVKQFLANESEGWDAQLELLTKKPVTAGGEEIVINPRSRSAKLRAARAK